MTETPRAQYAISPSDHPLVKKTKRRLNRVIRRQRITAWFKAWSRPIHLTLPACMVLRRDATIRRMFRRFRVTAGPTRALIQFKTGKA